MTIRALELSELPWFVELFNQLADFDGYGRQNVHTTTSQFQEVIFGDVPKLNVLVSAEESALIGFAAWSERFAARTGRSAMWLSDLFVVETHRRHGHGKALMKALLETCKERDFVRVEWKVVPGHPDTEQFYTALGARRSDMTLWELPE